ncbi:MAG: NAD(P)-dependent oxidoreductase [Aestuariivirga sp.]|uniref:NAD(P)-dependent oxidoreductase n=1 Tax=Aestuariivirga sp. TaxID=2650926 RepID=UPI0030177494
MHVGLIGAGMMGHGMAANLLRHGHQVTVIAHRNRSPVEDLVAKGAREARTLQEIAQAEVILLCLTTSKVVEDTIRQLKPHLRAGQIIMDAGTSAPTATKKLAHELAALGLAYADIPLTGGPEQAEQGVLGVLCGATPETFARIQPLLACFATTIRHFGPPGSGHTAKLISNYLVTGMVALVAEAFGAARAATIDWQDLYEVMLNGSGNSGVLRKMVEPALKGDFDGYRFALANAAKDIGYYAELAEGLGCNSKLTESVAEVFARAVETGHGGRNVSHLLDPAIDDVS